MPTQRELTILNRYKTLMEEAKLRISAIEAAANGDTGLNNALASEFCFLQLRMTCEVIALACLTAHGDAPLVQTSRVQKAYAADKIMTMLEGLHHNYYPNPVRHIDRRAQPHGGHIHRMEDAASGFLDKPDLLTLYRKCGEALHRGTIKRLSPLRPKGFADFAEVVGWGQRIVDLLGAHIIIFLDGERIIHCHWNTQGGVVRVSLGRAV